MPRTFIIPDNIKKEARKYKVLSSPIRLWFFKEILAAGKPVPVAFLFNLYRLQQSTISYHLAELLVVGLITETSVGTKKFYSIKEN